MDYLATEKGWFSPYLFTSGRRPIIPRSMKPDVVFCHGPFLSGDYRIGETLIAESASVITLCADSPPSPTPPSSESHTSLSLPTKADFPTLSNLFSRSRASSPEPRLTPLPPPPTPRHLVILVIGLKPHRKSWTSSARPSESVVNYQLLNGCPTIVVPAKVGAPLLAWDTLTLEELWKLPLPGNSGDESKFSGIVSVLFEYVDLCVEWDRVILSNAGESPLPELAGGEKKDDVSNRKSAVRDAVALLVAGAIRNGESKEVRKEVDEERSGIAMWRIP